MFNAEVCYGSGLVYDAELATAQVQAQVDDFMLDNDLASYFLGVCQDFKHFGFCVSVIILNEDASRIVRIVRKQACYVRFAPADKSGVIPNILYANWRNTVSPEDIERIELLNPKSPFTYLQNRGKKIKFHSINPKTIAMLISAHTLTTHRYCITAVSSRLQRRCRTLCHSSTSFSRIMVLG